MYFTLDFNANTFLPPANEVWGKVIFSQACVKNSVHGGGGACSQGVPALGVPALGVPALGVPVLGEGGCLHQGVWSWVGLQAHTQGEVERDQVQAHTQGGNWGGSGPGSPPTTTAAGGTHPTGMHSCYFLSSLFLSYVKYSVSYFGQNTKCAGIAWVFTHVATAKTRRASKIILKIGGDVLYCSHIN